MATCSACKYFVPVADTPGGHCRRYPPQVIFERYEVAAQAVPYFPYVEAGEWCGEHQLPYPSRPER